MLVLSKPTPKLKLSMQLSGCQEAVAEAVSLLGGRLDVLVNNAGQH